MPLADWLVPRLCPVCRRPLDTYGHPVCGQCLLSIPRPGVVRDPALAPLNLLANLAYKPCMAAAWMRYDNPETYARAIRLAKYYDRPALARDLGRLFASEIKATVPETADIDVLLPVPMHWTKRMVRGYNQAQEIARGIGEVLDIPVGDNLVALKPHSTQTRRSGRERRENVRGIYGVVHPEELDGLHTAIVDDIITTGATMAECTRALADWGASLRAISYLALAFA